jgi:hypothetical protein
VGVGVGAGAVEGAASAEMEDSDDAGGSALALSSWAHAFDPHSSATDALERKKNLRVAEQTRITASADKKRQPCVKISHDMIATLLRMLQLQQFKEQDCSRSNIFC